MTTIRVVDIETTGHEPPPNGTAEVIELGWQDVVLTGPPAPAHAAICDDTGSLLYGSEHPCPPEVRAVHHIDPDEYFGLEVFDQRVWSEAHSQVDIDILAAHNAAFEQSFLDPEGQHRWICTLKCARRAWPDAPGHSNQVLRYWLDGGRVNAGIDPERAHPPHRAGPDAYVTAWILARLLLDHSIDQLLQWSSEPLTFRRFGFGKHKGQDIQSVPHDYLDWIVFKSDMDHDTKWTCRQEMERRRAAAQAHRDELARRRQPDLEQYESGKSARETGGEC